MGQELSQCFLSDCRALRFHLWSKLCLSVPDCHTNPRPSTLHPTPPSSPCPHPSPPVTTIPAHGWKEYQIPCSNTGTLPTVHLSGGKITGLKISLKYRFGLFRVYPDTILTCHMNGDGVTGCNNHSSSLYLPRTTIRQETGDKIQSTLCAS